MGKKKRQFAAAWRTTLETYLRAAALNKAQATQGVTASLLSDAGVDYDVIQMAIGHVSDDMTDTYIIPDPQRLTDALNNLYKSVPPLGIKE